jgi:acyl carrier protein
MALMTDPVRDQVADIAAEILGLRRDDVEKAQTLESLPTFSSFRIMEIVERAESEFHVELDPNDLVPDKLFRLDALCQTLREASRRAGVAL